MSVFSAIFVLKENGTQSHLARFLNWGDHVNSVPDLAASPPDDNNKQKTFEIDKIRILLDLDLLRVAAFEFRKQTFWMFGNII